MNYNVNGTLKKDLHSNHITYREIASECNYSVVYIKMLMCNPLSSYYEALIKKAEKNILAKRG